MFNKKMANALLAPGKVTKGNLDPFVDKLEKLHRETAENHTKTLLALRNILTPDQLVQLKARIIKMKDIHGQMQLLRDRCVKQQQMEPQHQWLRLTKLNNNQ